MAKAKADEITLSRSDLMKALSIVKPALASRSAKLPDELMADFCLTGDSVFAYDGIIALRAPLDTGVSGAVKGDVLLGMLSNAAAKDVTMSVADGILTLKIVRSRIKLPLRSEELVNERFRWPALDKLTTRLVIEDRAVFARGLATVLKSAVAETGKGAELANVMLCPNGETTQLYSTDRRSFSQWDLSLEIKRWPKVEQTAGGIILPVSFCEEAISLMKAKDFTKEEMVLSFTDKLVILQVGGVVLLGRAVYPADPFDYQTKIVDKQFEDAKSEPWVITPAFRHAISRAAILVKGMPKKVGTLITGKKRELHLTTVADGGRIDDVVGTGETIQDGEVYVEPELIERCFDIGEDLELTLLRDAIAIKQTEGYLYIAASLGGARPGHPEEETTDPIGAHEAAGDPLNDEAPGRRRTAA